MFSFARFFRSMPVRWEIRDGQWILHPSKISVREVGRFWQIFLYDRQLNARYTSVQGAKLDAWEFAKRFRLDLFGTSRIRLAE